MAVDPTRPRRIACIGEVMIEIARADLAAGQARLGVAGDCYNTAVHLARLLPPADWQVAFVTRLGQDGLSGQMVAQMQATGVATDLVGRDPDRLPGIYAIELDPAGERSFRYWRSDSAARQLFSGGDPALDCLDGVDAVLLSLISLAILPPKVRKALIARLHRMKIAGKLVAFDSNYRPALWPDAAVARGVAAAMWRATSLALPSRDDEARLWPGESVAALMARLAGLGVGEIAVKNGAEGPQLWRGQSLTCGPFAPATQVVDTTGAGDGFNAGYIAARLGGATPQLAAERGHALALRVIASSGAIPPPV